MAVFDACQKREFAREVHFKFEFDVSEFSLNFKMMPHLSKLITAFKYLQLK